VDNTVDFFKNYTDKTHHGKEEDIIFREIGQKPISNENKEMLSQL
jgi:hemerythrin-like domain-containing protein